MDVIDLPDEERPRRRPQVPWWLLILTVLAVPAVIGSVSRLGDWAPLFFFFMFFAVLSGAALAWGYDSREGGDWPRR